MAINNILPFDLNETNMLSDNAYTSDTQRLNGVTSGIARSNLLNKVLHQVSVVCSSIGDLMSEYGYDCLDTNTDDLTNNMVSFWQNKVIGGTVSQDEGVYRNLLLSANISDDINNLALGRGTAYDIVYGLGYAFTYFANVTNETYKKILQSYDNRKQMADNNDSLQAIYNVEALRKLWRSYLFLTVGEIVKETTTKCASIDSTGDIYGGSDNAIVIKANSNIIITSYLAVSSNYSYKPYFSVDNGKTFKNSDDYGRMYFSSDFQYWYIIRNLSSNRGTSFSCGKISDFNTVINSGTLGTNYGSLFGTYECLIFKSGSYYWLFFNWSGGQQYAWAEAYALSSPTDLSLSGTPVIHSGLGYDNWLGVYQIGDYILAIWEGKTTSSALNGTKRVQLCLLNGNTVVATRNVDIEYQNYGNDVTYKCNVQFESNVKSNPLIYVYIYDTASGNKVEKVYGIYEDSLGVGFEELTTDYLIYNKDYNTRYVYTLKDKYLTSIAIDSDGYIVADSLQSYGKGFNYPSDMERKLQLTATANFTNEHDYYDLTRYIYTSNSTWHFDRYYVKDNSLYLDTIWSY